MNSGIYVFRLGALRRHPSATRAPPERPAPRTVGPETGPEARARPQGWDIARARTVSILRARFLCVARDVLLRARIWRCARVRLLFGRAERSQDVPERSQNDTERPQTSPRTFQTEFRTFQSNPQNGPEDPQNALERPQNSSERPQNVPGRPQKAPRTLQNDTRML